MSGEGKFIKLADGLEPQSTEKETRRTQSSLLESVKRNPGEAQALCQQFKSINARGESALSSQSIAVLAGQRNLNRTEAEIVATYVIGLNCPDVR